MHPYYKSFYEDENYLAHHGVQGQKWGVTNGPPYPLGRDVYDSLGTSNMSSLKSKIKSSEKMQNISIKTEEQKKKLTDAQKKAIIAASVIGAAAIAGGITAYYISKNKQNDPQETIPIELQKTDLTGQKFDPNVGIVKEGETISRIRGSDDDSIREYSFYTVNDADTEKYANTFANEINLTTSKDAYQITYKALKDINIANADQAKKNI